MISAAAAAPASSDECSSLLFFNLARRFKLMLKFLILCAAVYTLISITGSIWWILLFILL
jgi:hypothetical protein